MKAFVWKIQRNKEIQMLQWYTGRKNIFIIPLINLSIFISFYNILRFSVGFNSRLGFEMILYLNIFEINNIWLTAVRCGWWIPFNLIESLSPNLTLMCFTKEEQFIIPLIETDILRSPVVAISFFPLRRSRYSAIEENNASPAASSVF